jgi:hypothetical protein
MIVRATAKCPGIFTVHFLDGKIVDACESQLHESIIVEFPIFVAVRAIPVSRIVVPLVGEAHGDAVLGEGPKLFDQTVVEFLRPLAGEKSDDVLPSSHKLLAVPPARIEGVGESDLLWISRIPAIFGETHLLDRGFAGKWR